MCPSAQTLLITTGLCLLLGGLLLGGGVGCYDWDRSWSQDGGGDGPSDLAPAVDHPAPDAPSKDVVVTDSKDAFVPPGSWMKLPKGSFLMGSKAGTDPCLDGNEDPHPVTLTNAFEISATEVTQAMFLKLMGLNPSAFLGVLDRPVEKVTWHMAAAYCNALSAGAGHSSCYDCTGSGKATSCTDKKPFTGDKIYSCPGYRLPTEAEWEYAYRAGTTTVYYNGGGGSPRQNAKM